MELIEQSLTAVRIYEKLSEQGVSTSYSSIHRYISKIKIDDKICVRFHTPPEEEAQVDFGCLGRLPDKTGRLSKAYAFNMRLCYSRLDYFEIVFDQRVETFINCHITFANNYYSVPYQYVHKIVEVTLDIKLIKINYENQQIALHERCEAKGQFITNKAHYPKYKLYEPHSLEYQNKYHDKLKAIGQYAGDLFPLLVKY